MVSFFIFQSSVGENALSGCLMQPALQTEHFLDAGQYSPDVLCYLETWHGNPRQVSFIVLLL